MPTPIEIALSSLLPTTTYLPPILISLSTSLLAQSRTKASTLKPEEEIARTYACCHIACQRLGHKLGLEIGKPAPPVKPRVYERLLGYFNAVLKTTTQPKAGGRAAPRAPTANRSEDKITHSNGAARATRPAGTTPTREEKSAVTTPSSRKRSAPQAEAESLSTPIPANIPEHCKPLIRTICNSSNEPTAIPHVFAGLSSILHHLSTSSSAAKRRRTSQQTSTEASGPTSIEESQLPSLIIAIFVVVYNRFYDEEKVVDAPIEAAAIKALAENGDAVERVVGEARMLEEVKMFKEAIWTIWKEGEWIDNIPTPEDEAERSEAASPHPSHHSTNEADEDSDDVARTPRRPAKTPLRRKEKRGAVDADDDYLGAAGLLPGLGTMFQPQVDWLSAERSEQFERWRRGVYREMGLVVG